MVTFTQLFGAALMVIGVMVYYVGMALFESRKIGIIRSGILVFAGLGITGFGLFIIISS